MRTKWARTADTAGPRPNLLQRSDVSDRTCSIEGCEARHYARSWCRRHYRVARVHGDPLWTPPTVADRFWPKVRKTDGCWLWTAQRGPLGYGRFAVDSYPQQAHRVAYELLVGPIPDGLELDHLCRNPPCVNPAHLEPVTHRENMLRSPIVANRHTATECKRGHPFTEKNTGYKEGLRYCRRCHADYQNARYHAGRLTREPGHETPLPERRRVA
jgi:hypothetical protein